MLSMKHHECKVIYITFDPNDKSIDIYHKRVVRIDSEEGRLYMPVVSEYLRLQRQLDNLFECRLF